jgi:hypothetical protein
LQDENLIGATGTCGLLEGLKMNGSLKHLQLVSALRFCVFICGW